MDSAKRLLKQYLHHIVYLFIILLAAALRLYRLGSLPNGLNQDEAVNGFDAFTIGQNLRDHHGNFLPPMLESFGDWASPLITFITVPFVKVLGLSEFSVRLPVALLGIATVGLIYFLIVKLTNKRYLGILAMFILAISPWHITLSRWAIPPSIIPFFLVLFLLSAQRLVKQIPESISWKNLILTALSAVLLTYSYPTQKMFVPLLMITIAALVFRKYIVKGFVMLGIFGVLVLPIFLPTLLKSEKYNARFAQVSLTNSDENIIVGAGTRYAEYLSPYFHFGKGDANSMHHVPGFGATFGFLTVFFYLGLFASLYFVFTKTAQEKYPDLQKRLLVILLIAFFLAPIPASITNDHLHTLRVSHMLTLVPIFITLGIYFLLSLYKNKRFKQAICILIILVGSSFAGEFAYYYFGEYETETKRAYQYGVKELILYLKDNESEFDHVMIDADINQPYIYYLFYNKPDVNELNYKEVNASRDDKEIWRGTENLNKYSFWGFDESQEDKLEQKHSIDTGKEERYIIYTLEKRKWVVLKK
jgi:4-amino-4-deoxy-L-arabinose transferase-like glycosyltransferase